MRLTNQNQTEDGDGQAVATTAAQKYCTGVYLLVSLHKKHWECLQLPYPASIHPSIHLMYHLYYTGSQATCSLSKGTWGTSLETSWKGCQPLLNIGKQAWALWSQTIGTRPWDHEIPWSHQPRKRQWKRVRKQKCGKPAGTHANPSYQLYQSILLSSIPSLNNKLDYLRLKLSNQCM